VPDAPRWAASMRTTASSSCAATHRLPLLSNARPWGLLMPVRSTIAIGLPPARAWAAENFTTLSAATTETHRFPSGSKASTLGPGMLAPNDGLSMTTSGTLSPSLANIDAGYRATGGSAVVPPSTHMLPSRSNVNPSEPPVFAATSAVVVPVVASASGPNPSIVKSPGALLTPAQSKPLVGTSAYLTFTTVVPPMCTHAVGGSTVAANTWLVMPVWGELTGAAVIACVPAGTVTIPLVVCTPATPAIEMAAGSCPVPTSITVPSPLHGAHDAPPEPPHPATPAAPSSAPRTATRAPRAKSMVESNQDRPAGSRFSARMSRRRAAPRGGDRLAAPARSAGSRLPEKTIVAHRACGAERLGRLSLSMYTNVTAREFSRRPRPIHRVKGGVGCGH